MSINFGSTRGVNMPRTFDAISSNLQPNASSPMPNDSIQIEQVNQKPKKGLIQGTKDTFRSLKKFFTTVGGYTGATFKGAWQGFAAGSMVFTGASIAKAITKKKIPVKPLGIIAAIAAVGINYWKASLDINQKRSEIDLRWKKTPINS